MNDFFFRKLVVYQKAIDMVDHVYDIIDSFPAYEQNALSSQLRRAAISVPSNIAEGMGRFSLKERIHFVEISYASLMETMCQIEIAARRHYIGKEQFESLQQEIQEIARTASGLRTSLIEKKDNINSNQGENEWKKEYSLSSLHSPLSSLNYYL